MYSPKQVDRFWARVSKSDGCWLWGGSTVGKGYGRVYMGYQSKRRGPDGRLHADTELAHRFSYIVHFGPVPDGMIVCHTCDNPPCVNPSHLFLGTNGDNVRDMYAKGRGGYRGSPGESNSHAKLQASDVYAMRARYRVLVNSLADEYAVTRSLVRQILRGEVWRLPEDPQQSTPIARMPRPT